MMAKRSRISSEGSPVIVWAVAICVIVALGSVGSFAAKYVLSDGAEAPSSAKSFYLESDLLSDSQTAPKYTLQAGVDDISFTLMNYPDELRTSEVDITATATLSGGPTSKDEETVTFDADGRVTQTVTFEGLDPGTYLVKVETKPYAKTLSAYFTIQESEGLTYEVRDSEDSPFLQVTVTTDGYSGKITITWPDGVLPDNTDPLLAKAEGSSRTVTVKDNAQYTFLFFKEKPNENYTSSITVKPYPASA